MSFLSGPMLALILVVLATNTPAHSAEPPALQRITVCERPIQAEVASTLAQQRQGLMHRSRLKPDHGMLFAYDREEVRAFWMKNVPMDLDIGFFDSNKKLVHWLTMKGTLKDPHAVPTPDAELPQYSSQKPFRYAVELRAGFFRNLEAPGGLKRCTLSLESTPEIR